MVIQRWQSLFLLIAVIIMGCLSFSPLATLTVEGKEASTIYLTDLPVLMVVDILVAVILFISIFREQLFLSPYFQFCVCL